MSSSPDFIIAGTARAGTTMLARLLDEHPAVAITDPKEPHFFSCHTMGVAFTGPGDDETINRSAVVDPARYRTIIDAARARAEIVGDGSVSTLYHHAASIPTIRRYAPDAHIVVILRDPVERAHSSYLYLRSRGLEPEDDFATALTLESDRIDAGWHHMWHYARMGLYSEQVDAFLREFGPDQMSIVLYEDLTDDPVAVAVELLATLGVADHAIALKAGENINQSGVPRNAVVAKLAGTFYRSPALRKVATSVLPARARDRIRAATLTRPGLPADVRAEHIVAYLDDVIRLEGLVERDLSDWRTA